MEDTRRPSQKQVEAFLQHIIPPLIDQVSYTMNWLSTERPAWHNQAIHAVDLRLAGGCIEKEALPILRQFFRYVPQLVVAAEEYNELVKRLKISDDKTGAMELVAKFHNDLVDLREKWADEYGLPSVILP